MGRRSSNVTPNRWAVRLLDVQPADRVLELGCGPGVAIAALASRGMVVGVDHSAVMIGQRRRNRAAVRAGRSTPRRRSTRSACGPTPPAGSAKSPGCCGPANGSPWCRSRAVPARPRPLRRRPRGL